MNLKLMAVAAAAVALVALSTVPARAQATRPAAEPLEIDRWTATPFLAAGLGGDLDNSAVTVGGALAYNFTRRVALEGSVSYMNPEQGELFTFETNVWNFDANVLYHFAEENWIPYVTAGLGAMYVNADLDDIGPLPGVADESETELALNFGGGVKRDLSERIRFRGDLRYYNAGDLAPDFWRLSAGLTFLLGR